MKRMRKKKVAAIANIAAVSAFLVGFGIFSVIGKKPTTSEYERRDLAAFPDFSLEALFSGAYTENIDKFYADTFPMRDNLVRLGAYYEEARGLRYDDIRLHDIAPQQQASGAAPLQDSPSPSGSGPNPGTPVTPEPGSSPQDPDASGGSSSQPAPQYAGDDELREQMGSIYTYHNQAFSPFGGSEAQAARYANAINQYYKSFEGKVKVYNLVIPTHIEFALPDKYKSITNPQKPNIDFIYSKLDPAVKSVDAYSVLEAHKDEYLYFATDHHWTALGAYYAYTAFAKEAGFEPKSLDSMEKKTIPDFIGSMFTQTQDIRLKENPDYVDYYITDTDHSCYQILRNQPYYPRESTVWAEYAKGVNSYSVFLAGDYPVTAITSNTVHNGKRIMVVKESFGNAFAPFLIPHYEQVFVVDQRYFQRNGYQFILDNKINEILFINNIYAANTSSQIAHIEQILWQPDYVPPKVTEAPETEETEETASAAESTGETSGPAAPEPNAPAETTAPGPEIIIVPPTPPKPSENNS